MKRRSLLVGLMVVGVLLPIWYWGMVRSGPRFSTPLECLEAYREACVAGDANAYLECLAEPLRAETEQRFPDRAALAESLRAQSQTLKGWAALPADAPASQGAETRMDVEETRITGKRRVRFVLRSSSQGWRIVAIGRPVDVPTDIPYGTHLRDTRD
jgi:hypothetical protein